MSEQEMKLLKMIYSHKDPQKALTTAINVIVEYLAAHSELVQESKGVQ